MEACIRRVWLEHPPLTAKALEELRMSLAEWEAWKQSRAEQVGRIIAVGNDYNENNTRPGVIQVVGRTKPLLWCAVVHLSFP